MQPIANNLSDILKKVDLTQGSNLCESHQAYMFRTPFGEFCPQCTKEDIQRENEKLVKIYSEKREREHREAKRNKFERESLVADKRIKEVTFDSYLPATKEAEVNKEKALMMLEQYKQGKVFNLFFVGNCGSGKTHLSYSMVKELSLDHSALFITMGELLRKIKSTFKKDSNLSEDDIITKLTRATFLVIDDLGAELGSLDSDKKASDFINRVLFDVLDGRQDKSTIFTTNLTGAQIEEKYDERSYSRMFRDYDVIKFIETKDYRKKRVEF